MNLVLRLRRLEEQLPSSPPRSPFVEWVTTPPIDDMRAIRDYLQASLDGESEDVLLEDERYGRARAACGRACRLVNLRRRTDGQC